MEKGILETEKGFYCYINQVYYPTLRGLLNYLRTQNMTSNEYYLKYLGEVGYCEHCGNPTNFRGINTGYKEYCCSECGVKSEKHRNAVRQRFVGQPEKLFNSLEKARLTRSQRSEEEKAKSNKKRMQTIRARYGDDYQSNRTKNQWKRRTQEEIDTLVAKTNATKRKNGTLGSIPYKFANKEVTIGNRIFKVQGYEDIALKLLAEIVDVNEIKVGADVPRINLTDGTKYYPDILINNLIIEVKREYTYNVCLEENLLKQKETINSGYNHIFLIIHSRDLNKDRSLKDKQKYLDVLHMAISNQASKEEGSTTIP